MPRDRQRALPALRRPSRTALAGRFVAGARGEDALRIAGELVSTGRTVALEHVPGRSADAVAELVALTRLAESSGLARSCELSVPVDRLGADGARRVAAAAAMAGVGICLTGLADPVDELATSLPDARTAVPATGAGAEERCRTVAGRPVRLVAGRGRAADRTLVRCLNLLMPAPGHLAVAASDRLLVAVVGERAAWYDRAPGSWEHVLPYGVRTAEQQRLVASGAALRVVVPSGPGAAVRVVRRLVAGAA
jgi:proline dehydrogenase